MVCSTPDLETIQNWMFGACERDDVALMQKCLDAGADANAQDRSRIPFLYIALNLGSCGVATLLLDAGATVSNDPWNFHEPHIVMACRKGCLSALEKLIAGGADVNVPDSFGLTPMKNLSVFMSESPEEQRKMAKMLRDAGAK